MEAPDSFAAEAPDSPDEPPSEDFVAPLLSLPLPSLLALLSLPSEEPWLSVADDVDEDDERESVTYQPLPLKTMPTGWITLRSEPPQCSQVVSGGSEKLWRFSVISLQAVQV